MPFLSNIGPGELILILIIALVVFGPGKLPEVGQALGRGIREFRRAASDVTDATRIETTTGTPQPGTPVPTSQPVTAAPAAAPPVAAVPPPAPPPPAAPTAAPAESAGQPTDPGQPAA